MDASGVGPSDHTSFYNQGMPVLHFFTGSHDDYHKPSDDSDKINFKGIAEIVSLIKTVMAKADGMQRLEFQQTKSEESRSVPAFSVTLGVMPDYMYEDGGLRIDGVTEGKPAAAAGLQKGDIITEMGQFQIADIYAYMSALAAFKKGDEVKITYLREGEKKHTHVKF
jgi:C-terminal processing protease CtpA/Prc